MSDVTAVFVISFIVATGFFLNMYIASLTVALSGKIVTGVMEGSTIPKGARRALIFQAWVPWQVLGVASAALFGLAAFLVADVRSAFRSMRYWSFQPPGGSHEAQAIYRDPNHRHPERSRARRAGHRPLPQARHEQCDVLHVAQEVRRDECRRGQAAPAARG